MVPSLSQWRYSGGTQAPRYTERYDQIYGYGHVPLYLACFGGHRETVSLLSERGADFSARGPETRRSNEMYYDY